MHSFLLLLQETAESPAGEQSTSLGANPLIFMAGLAFIFYFLMIRPQMKEQKKRRLMLAELKKNDRVVTNGGMYGIIVNITDDEVTLKIDDNNNVRARFTRAAVTGLAQKAQPEKEAKSD